MLTDPDQAAVPVIEEIGVQIDLLDRAGGRYVRDCLAHELAGRPRPRTPAGMHHVIAKALREMAKDQAVAVHLYGLGRCVRPGERMRNG